MRHRVSEVTRSYDYKGEFGSYLMVTWEWNNGFNLVDSRRATPEEIQQHLEAQRAQSLVQSVVQGSNGGVLAG